MANNQIRKKAKSFCREFSLNEITTASLKKVIEQQGYTVIEFNNIYNDENVSALIESLHLSKMIETSKGFTYADSNYRLVFLHEDLSDSEKLLVLAHEEGHIYCKHLTSAPVIGKDVSDEYEANEFAHFLLNQGLCSKLLCRIKDNKKVVIPVLAAVIIIISAFGFWQAVKNHNQPFGEYYITTTGSKYHKKDCIFVKDKDNVSLMTAEQFEDGEYQACKTCLPDK